MLSNEELFRRYVMGQEYIGRKRTDIRRGDFMAGLVLAQEFAERELAFIQVHETLQERALALDAKVIELTYDLTEARADNQRLLTIYEDPEE